MRLHELTPEQIQQWRHARWEAGHSKYGDAHLQRYGLVDVMEELLDAINILSLFLDRVQEEIAPDAQRAEVKMRVYAAEAALDSVARQILDLDAIVPDELCTDERGGDRIWWSEQVRGSGMRDKWRGWLAETEADLEKAESVFDPQDRGTDVADWVACRGEKLLEGFRLMAEILRGLEWSGWDERFRAHMCPVCGGYKSKNKHFLDCDLNKALSFLRGVGRE